MHEDAGIHALIGAPPGVQIEMMRARGLPEAVVLVLVNSCENRCFFCASPGTTAVPPADVTRLVRIRAHLEARPPGVTRLVLGGNEPTLHPDFERTLSIAHEAGFEHIELMTSGTRLEDRERLLSWRSRGLAAIAVPLYAPTAALHDSVCGTASFDRLVRCLDTARDVGLTIHLHTLLLRRTAGVLAELARMAHDRWGATLAVAPLRDKGELFRFEDETIPLDEARRLLETIDVPIARLGLATCAAPHRPRASSLVMEVYFQTQRRRFGSSCVDCLDRTACPGVVDAELDRFGDAGLRPRLASGGRPS